MWETVKCDVLVIGGGAAAARAAIEAADKGASVVLVDKGTFEASGSSPVALNGLATTIADDDSPQIFFKDMVEDGYSLNDQNLVWEAAQGAEENVFQLERLGFIFHKKGNKYQFSRGVGHSAHREVIFDRETSYLNPVALLGKEAWKRGVKLYDHIMVSRLLKRGERVVGAVGFNQQRKCYHFSAKTVVLAAGGANYLYSNTCERINKRNFRTTGDAFSLAFHAEVPLIDLEFTNFREGEGHRLAKLGAKLVNAQGQFIMERYAPDKLERAPRGKLVEAISTENYDGRGPVYWQLPPEMKEEEIKYLGHQFHLEGKRFRVIIDYQRLLGGIRINHDAETNLKGLLAAGETAGGFHGADRMQGAAFLETTFFGARAGAVAAQLAHEASQPRIAIQPIEEELASINRFKGKLSPDSVIQETRNIMWEKMGVLREEAYIKQALELIQSIRREKIPSMSGSDLFACLEAENLALTAEMVARAALIRQESRGCHVRRDFPGKNDSQWRKHIAVYNRNGEMILESLPVISLSQAERYKENIA